MVSAAFGDYTGYLTRQDARRELEKHLPGYHKAMRVYPDKVERQAVRAAILRARSLAQRAIDNGLGSYDNPCSHVCELVDLMFSTAEQLHPS